MEQRFEIGNDEIARIKRDLIFVIKEEQKILFAYLHGSFGSLPFRDIDIAAYCKMDKDEVFDFELKTSSSLEIVAGYPVDFKVINDAPIGFQFSVIYEGKLFFERERDVRLDFLEETAMRYMDYSGFSRSFLRELVECTKM